MNAETVRAALAALPCTVVRGADRGLPPPTLGYALSREEGGWLLTLRLRAALCEQNDELLRQAMEQLAPMGFLLHAAREGEERDTGIKTAELTLKLFESPDLMVEGATLAACRAAVDEGLPALTGDLGGAWRRVGEGAFSMRVTAPLAARNTAAQRLLAAGTEGVGVAWMQKNWTAYLIRREILTDRADMVFVLKEEI